ncbi:MAG: hypothetical protein ABI338_05030 [Gemmatimonadaceae bacterium]
MMMEFLDDILVKLAATTSAPRTLTSFVIASFRNHVTDVRRESAARGRYVREHSSDEQSDQVAGAGCSGFMLRAAEGPSATDGRPPSEELMQAVLERCSASQLGDEDRAVLVRLLRRGGVAVDTDNTRGTAA